MFSIFNCAENSLMRRVKVCLIHKQSIARACTRASFAVLQLCSPVALPPTEAQGFKPKAFLAQPSNESPRTTLGLQPSQTHQAHMLHHLHRATRKPTKPKKPKKLLVMPLFSPPRCLMGGVDKISLFTCRLTNYVRFLCLIPFFPLLFLCPAAI